MREKVPFRSLRQRLEDRFKKIRDSVPERDVPPTFSKNDESVTALSGSHGTPEGGLFAWRDERALVFSPSASAELTNAQDDLLRNSDLGQKISQETALTKLLDCAFAVVLEGKPVPEAVKGTVDDLLQVNERVTFVTPILGFVPASGSLAFGGFRFLNHTSPEALALIDTIDFGGSGGPFESPDSRARIAGILADYRKHSIAVTSLPGKPGRVVELARDRLEYVLGALRFFTCSSTAIPSDRFKYRANGDPWDGITHSMTALENRPLRPHLRGLVGGVVKLDSSTIPVTAHSLFGLLDRILQSPDSELTEFEWRLRESLFWFGRAQDSDRIEDSFLLAFISLETLFKSVLNKTDTVSVFVGLMIGKALNDPAHQAEWTSRLASLYGIRGRMTHEGARGVVAGDVEFLLGAAVVGFDLVAQLVTSGTVTNEQQLYEWLIESLPAGPELDRFVWSKRITLVETLAPRASSSSRREAEAVVDGMESKGWTAEVDETGAHPKVRFSKGPTSAEVSAGTFALAVCRAALLALGRTGLAS